MYVTFSKVYVFVVVTSNVDFCGLIFLLYSPHLFRPSVFALPFSLLSFSEQILVRIKL